MPKVCPVCGTTYTDTNVFCPTDGTTLRSADVDGDLIGTVVADRYLVTDLLGEGGMGRVYLARHVRLPQQAAIKVLRPALVRDPASVARFNREASNASRIEHERVARVFDFGETSEGTVYIAMEYVPGRTVKKLLADEAPLAPLRAAALIKQVADGLDAAHRMGIVHRDLKPDNILVMTDDVVGDRAKVVDFGIAKAIGGDSNEAGLTQTGFVVGTPEFMAPEQMLGGLIDARTDMYALALVAFQCLTNSLPFDTTTPDRGLTARMTEAPRRLDFVASNVTWPAQLQAVFDKALVRDSDQRFPTAGAFADAFTQAVHAWVGAPILGSTAPYTAASAASNSPAASATAAMGNSAAAENRSAGRVADAKSKAVAPASSNKPMLIGGIVAVGLAAVIVAVMVFKSGDSTTPGGVAANPDTSAAVAQNSVPTPPNADTTTRKTDSVTAPGAANPTTTTPPPRPQTAGNAQTQREITPVIPERKPNDAANMSVSAGAAVHTLDSVRTALASADSAQALKLVSLLQRVLPRLPTLTDSVWAYLGMFEANSIAGQDASACTPLRKAKNLAVTPQQTKAVGDYYGAATCSP